MKKLFVVLVNMMMLPSCEQISRGTARNSFKCGQYIVGCGEVGYACSQWLSDSQHIIFENVFIARGSRCRGDQYNCRSLALRGGRGEYIQHDDENIPAKTRAAAGGSNLSPRMFKGKRKRGPDTFVQDQDQSRFENRFRGSGESDLSALQEEEAELFGNTVKQETGPSEARPTNLVPDFAAEDEFDGVSTHASKKPGKRSKITEDVPKWAQRPQPGEEGLPLNMGPVTFTYDHEEAAAELEAEERNRSAISHSQ